MSKSRIVGCAILTALIVVVLAPAASGEDGGACGPPPKVQFPDERRVCSPDELRQVLASPFTGRVVIPNNADWDLRSSLDQPILSIHSNVQLVGERGDLGSRPTLRASFQPPVPPKGEDDHKYSLFEIHGSNVRIEGIHFRGPKSTSTFKTREPYVRAISVFENDELPESEGRNVVIADNEFELWSGAGVEAKGPHPLARQPADYEPGWKHRTWADVGQVRILRNYMHHNVMNDGGYGVVIAVGGYATVEGNVFDTNRHAVAADGKAYEGYLARYNYVLEGGFKQGSFYNQHFDVHGTLDHGYGGAAGTRFEIESNTVRGEQGYYCAIHCFASRPALMLRGRPSEGMFFHDNVLVHDDEDEAVNLKRKLSVQSVLLPSSKRQFNFHDDGGNQFDKDYTREIGAGDFDGDGRTDVFVATGTAWFYSRAGIAAWELLHVSARRTGDLGFADMDNDRATDVVFRESDGRIGYLKSGTQAPVFLTSAPIEMKELRFGDFDGDSRTDIFYSRNEQWRIWYARDRRWHNAQTSVTPVRELVFGEFDNVKGTDVVAAKKQGWSYSSAGLGSYTKLNADHGSLKDAKAVDVDGNGRSDIVLSNGQYSRDGRTRPVNEFDRPETDWIVGQFEGGSRSQVITWDKSGLLLMIERGPNGKRLARRSAQNMR